MIRYTLKCHKCNSFYYIFPMDYEDFYYCQYCNSKNIELTNRTGVT